MPGRNVPLVNEQIYHIFNRGVAKRSIFLTANYYRRALETIWFYQKDSLALSFSDFLSIPSNQKPLTNDRIEKLPNRIEIIAYCLMPNHLHILIKQLIANGISSFMSDFQNSFTKYFNIKNKRKGHLFEGKFKAVRIETDEQLIHTSRYIHLNPTTSSLVKDASLHAYPWSSLPEYLNEDSPQKCSKESMLAYFKNRKDYREFVYDQIDYQRSLRHKQHLFLDDY